MNSKLLICSMVVGVILLHHGVKCATLNSRFNGYQNILDRMTNSGEKSPSIKQEEDSMMQQRAIDGFFETK